MQIISMNVVILASGVTPYGLWVDFHNYGNTPKSIMPLFDGETILDFQMRALADYNVWIVVGFEADKIRKHCADRDYKVHFIEDKGWAGEYSSNRTLMEIAPTLLAFDEFILMFGDVIFEKCTLDYLTASKADICNAVEKNQLVKFTRHGFAAVLKMINEDPMLGIGSRMLGELGKTMKVEPTPPAMQLDLDRPEDIRPMRETFKYLFDR